MNINKIARDRAFNDLDSLAIDDKRFVKISDLDDDDKELFYSILQKAQFNVLRKTVSNNEDFAIGKLKIKETNKIALKYKNKIAEELGYSNFREVPKDKLQELNEKVRLLTISEIKENNVNKKHKVKGKALKFNVK